MAITGAARQANSPIERSGPNGGKLRNTLQDLGGRALGAMGGVAATILNMGLGLLAGLVLIVFFTLLLLTESSEWLRKVQSTTRPLTEWRLAQSADVIASKVRAYLLTRVVLGLLTAALYAGWLWFWAVDLILVWALLTFLLSFAPVIGSLLAGLIPVAFAFLTLDLRTALIVGAGILLIEQVMGNYVDPRLEGHHIALSPLVLLASLVFWSWM